MPKPYKAAELLTKTNVSYTFRQNFKHVRQLINRIAEIITELNRSSCTEHKTTQNRGTES